MKTKKVIIFIDLVIFLFFVALFTVFGNNALLFPAINSIHASAGNDTLRSGGNAYSGIFDSDELIDITILTDIYALRKDIGENREYHNALLIYKAFDTVDVITEAKIKTRGRLRRSKEVCNFPPLKVKIKTIESIGTIFNGNEEFKIVTHCQTSKDFYQQYLLLEYVIYKMYQVISRESFNVRLARITYSDFNSKVDDIVKFAFILEDDEMLASRLNGKILEVENIHPNYTAPSKMNRLALFQYMVGNTDWSVKVLHNIKLLFIKNSAPIPIPYDFDYAGLVNANYAVPADEISIQSVRERYYNGYCRSAEDLEENLQVFRDNEQKIMDLIIMNEYLTNKVRERNEKYIKEFFEIINDPKKIKQNFINNCRTN